MSNEVPGSLSTAIYAGKDAASAFLGPITERWKHV
jgi:hypothetical protein